jgi:hypothetical protein
MSWSESEVDCGNEEELAIPVGSTRNRAKRRRITKVPSELFFVLQSDFVKASPVSQEQGVKKNYQGYSIIPRFHGRVVTIVLNRPRSVYDHDNVQNIFPSSNIPSQVQKTIHPSWVEIDFLHSSPGLQEHGVITKTIGYSIVSNFTEDR